MKYHDLKIVLRGSSGRYTVKWTFPEGTLPGDNYGEKSFDDKKFELNVQDKIYETTTIEQFLKDIENGEFPPPKVLEKVGGHLYKMIIGPYGDESLFSKAEELAAIKYGLRLCLDIQAQELVSIPWELLWHQEFIARKSGLSIVRYINTASSVEVSLKISSEEKLKILLVSASPSNNPFDEEQYIKPVKAAFKEYSDVFDVDVLKEATREDLITRLGSNKYSLFHFVGHGHFDENNNGGIDLLNEKRDKQAEHFSANDLSTWLQRSGVKLAFLCSCETAKTSVQESFRGVTHNLVQKGGIPAVVAMPYKFPQGKVAIGIVNSFYRSLLMPGNTIDDAVNAARASISDDQIWWIPVLYGQYSEWRLTDKLSSEDKIEQSRQQTPFPQNRESGTLTPSSDSPESSLGYILLGYVLVGIDIVWPMNLNSLWIASSAFLWVCFGVTIWTLILIFKKRWSRSSGLALFGAWSVVWLVIWSKSSLIWAFGWIISICLAMFFDNYLLKAIDLKSKKSDIRLVYIRLNPYYVLCAYALVAILAVGSLTSFYPNGPYSLRGSFYSSESYPSIANGFSEMIRFPVVLYGMREAAEKLKNHHRQPIICFKRLMTPSVGSLIFGFFMGYFLSFYGV
jgi:CHAT domain-containing protein